MLINSLTLLATEWLTQQTTAFDQHDNLTRPLDRSSAVSLHHYRLLSDILQPQLTSPCGVGLSDHSERCHVAVRPSSHDGWR